MILPHRTSYGYERMPKAPRRARIFATASSQQRVTEGTHHDAHRRAEHHRAPDAGSATARRNEHRDTGKIERMDQETGSVVEGCHRHGAAATPSSVNNLRTKR